MLEHILVQFAFPQLISCFSTGNLPCYNYETKQRQPPWTHSLESECWLMIGLLSKWTHVTWRYTITNWIFTFCSKYLLNTLRIFDHNKPLIYSLYNNNISLQHIMYSCMHRLDHCCLCLQGLVTLEFQNTIPLSSAIFSSRSSFNYSTAC